MTLIWLNLTTNQTPTLGAHDLHVKMSEPTRDGQSHLHHALGADWGEIEVVVQRTLLMVVRHQP